jgi:hypothetical protein
MTHVHYLIVRCIDSFIFCYFTKEVIELHRNQFTGTLSTTNICDRLDPGRSYTRLLNLTADCDKMTCDCCTACYINGELASGG